MVNNSTTEQALRNLIAATEEISESFGVDVKPFKTEHQLIENNVICALTMARSALQSNKHSDDVVGEILRSVAPEYNVKIDQVTHDTVREISSKNRVGYCPDCNVSRIPPFLKRCSRCCDTEEKQAEQAKLCEENSDFYPSKTSVDK